MAKEIDNQALLAGKPKAMNAKEAYLEGMLRAMTAEGAQFHIRFADGRELGEAIPPNSSQGPRRDWSARYSHVDIMRKLKPGDGYRFYLESPEESMGFQGAIAGMASHVFGAENYTTAKFAEPDGRFGVDIYLHP